MPNIPQANNTYDETAGASAGGEDLICILAPVPVDADCIPRLFGGASAVYNKHGYADGIEYVKRHEATRKPVLFCGLPIATPGVVSREDVSGNSGTSVSAIVAGGDGVLCEHRGRLRVKRGGTVGTDQIHLEHTLDDGRSWKTIRLGTAVSYAVPYVGITYTFTEGKLVTGDVIHTWHASGPAADADGLTAAFAQLKKGTRLYRTGLLIGDVPDSTMAAALATLVAAYETTVNRPAPVRCSVPDKEPEAELSHTRVTMTGSPALTFADAGETDDAITRNTGSWIADGFLVGQTVTVGGSESNNVTGVLAGVSASTLTFDDTALVAEGQKTGCTVTAVPTLTFVEGGGSADTIVRSHGSWLTDGFRGGSTFTVDGTGSNDGDYEVESLTASTLTLVSGEDLTDETIGIGAAVTVEAGQTWAEWMAASEAAFATVDSQRLINLSAGRGSTLNSFSGWSLRRPASWAASLREYQHDTMIHTWRKADGPVDFDLYDPVDRDVLVEYDDREGGGAGSLARFTTFRTWANGPRGAFISQDCTRAPEGSMVVHMANSVTVCRAMVVCTLNTELAVGQLLDLNEDGTATTDSLNLIAQRVNDALALDLRGDKKGEGPRVSSATWTPNTDTLFNVPEPVLTGVLAINMRGVVHSVETRTRVNTGG